VNLEGKGQTSDRAAAPKECPSCGARYSADAVYCPLDGSALTTPPGAIAAAAATDPYLGREILGHIEIRELVGVGATGRVYRAFQKGIDRDVAVKILHRELSANPTVVSRFDREAKVASRLAHPHVVQVLLVGQLPDGAMYIVMEYLDGISLQGALARAGGAMPLPRALHIAVNLCDAAGEAHAQGIVHRDLKPENVMLVLRADDPDFVKVLDFGIARLNWGDQSIATAAGLIFGTARYISPEAARGERVGPQGDVYSIATMIYQMLSGRTPFEADQVVALLVQQIHDPPPPLRSMPRSAHVPEPIAAVVMKNLSKRAADRADDARTFGRQLLEAAMIGGLSAQDVLARPAMTAGTATAFETPVPQGVDGWTDGGDGRTVARTEIGPRAPATTSKPPSSVETTMADAEAPPGRPRGPARALMLMVACFLGGGVGMAGVAWWGGMLGRGSPRAAPALPASGQATGSAGVEGSIETPGGQPAPADSALPPLVSARAPSATPGAVARAVIDAPSGKPSIGQPVDFSARILGGSAASRAKAEGARFHVSGPGIGAGADLPAADDGSGVLRATFVFPESGRFDVSFLARVDGAPVRAARVVVVESPPTPPSASAARSAAPPAPSPSAKWL